MTDYVQTKFLGFLDIMPNKFFKPIRMCINCRVRLSQNDLIRLHCVDRVISPHNGKGRSFYICLTCLDNKKLKKSLSRECKANLGNFEQIVEQLKEIAANERKDSDS